MRHDLSSTLCAALLVALAAGCSKKPEPATSGAGPGTAPAGAAPLSMRDLAAATALDARLARFSLVASDVQAALAPQGATPTRAGAQQPDASRDRARSLLPQADAALAEVERAVAAVTHPGDRLQASAVLGAAKTYSGKLAAAVTGDASALPELFAARDALGAAIAQYRSLRSRWRLDAPEPQGAEREFAEARRDLERAESAFGSRTRVAPREEGHEFDPSAARMTGLAAAERARSAAERLAPPLHDPAVRYAAAEAQAFEAVTALAQPGDADGAAAARRYHAAKADALAALADYFAALAGR